jgi:GTPase SAR1 family protein
LHISRTTSGKIIDIRTGRAIASTDSLTASWVDYMQLLVENDKPFYLVHGRCRHSDVRQMITELKQILEDVPIIYDARMPSDTMWAFEGTPDELGFAV